MGETENREINQCFIRTVTCVCVCVCVNSQSLYPSSSEEFCILSSHRQKLHLFEQRLHYYFLQWKMIILMASIYWLAEGYYCLICWYSAFGQREDICYWVTRRSSYDDNGHNQPHVYLPSSLFQIYAFVSLCSFLFDSLRTSLEIKETVIIISLIQYRGCFATVN